MKQIYPSSSTSTTNTDGSNNSDLNQNEQQENNDTCNPSTTSTTSPTDLLDTKIEQAINASKILWYNQGYTLTKEGDPSHNNIYVVLSGELTRWKNCGKRGKR